MTGHEPVAAKRDDQEAVALAAGQRLGQVGRSRDGVELAGSHLGERGCGDDKQPARPAGRTGRVIGLGPAAGTRTGQLDRGRRTWLLIRPKRCQVGATGGIEQVGGVTSAISEANAVGVAQGFAR